MMKKQITLLAIVVAMSVNAQNFQLHRDFEREHFTSTFTFYKVDKLGNTFTFVEFDYGAAHGINMGYFELARVLKTKNMPVGLHLEYNGGVGTKSFQRMFCSIQLLLFFPITNIKNYCIDKFIGD